MSTLQLDDARAVAFTSDVLPLLFPAAPQVGDPELVLLGGVPGAGSSRAVGRLRTELGAGAVVVRAAELATLAADREELVGAGGSEAVAGISGEWVRASLQHAREQRRSIILDGGLRSPEVVAGLAGLYKSAGYTSRVVVVAARRADALLTGLSNHLDSVRSGKPEARFSSDLVARGLEETLAVLDTVSSAGAVDRVVVLDSTGVIAFDSAEPNDMEAPSAAEVLAELEGAPMSTREAVAWLGELKRTATFAESRRMSDPGVTETLIELYEYAVHEVIPRLAVNAGSTRGAEVLSVQEHGAAAQLVALRRIQAGQQGVDLTAPVVTVPGSSTGGPSL